MESLGVGGIVHELSFRVLGVGYNEQSEESLQGAGEWWNVEQEGIPAVTVADCEESEGYQVGEWRDYPRRWVV